MNILIHYTNIQKRSNNNYFSLHEYYILDMWDYQAIVIVANSPNFQKRRINNNEFYSNSRFNTDRRTKKLYSCIGIVKCFIKHWSTVSLLMD